MFMCMCECVLIQYCAAPCTVTMGHLVRLSLVYWPRPLSLLASVTCRCALIDSQTKCSQHSACSWAAISSVSTAYDNAVDGLQWYMGLVAIYSDNSYSQTAAYDYDYDYEYDFGVKDYTSAG